MITWSRTKIRSSLSILLAIIGLAITTSLIVPNYFTGQWSWTIPPQLASTQVLKHIRNEGITLPHWATLEQQTVDLGHKKWSIQVLVPKIHDGAPIDPNLSIQQGEQFTDHPLFLFLRPQTGAKDEPLVEWIDFDGIQQWTADQDKIIHFSTDSGEQSVTAHYFRGWNRNHTYAVVQWYGWPTGGNPKISSWFWADQWSQWRDRQRMPWVAVSLLIPIEPLGDIQMEQPFVEAIAQSIQTALEKNIPAPTSAL